LCGRSQCRRQHHNRLARARRKNDLAQSRADERRRQASHRAHKEPAIAPGGVRMSRTRSAAEVIDMVEEIQKMLARLERWTRQLSRTGSTPQRANQTTESGDLRG
jgi:hypothetical protein